MLTLLYPIAVALHILSAVIWIGGMFFAYVCLRPVLSEVDSATRLNIWVGVFKKFFVWVSISIGVLFVTGFYLIYVFGGFDQIGYHVWAMLGIAVIMGAIYKFLLLAPFRHLCEGVEKQDYAVAAFALGTIRKLVATNLILGLLVICIATIFRF